MAAATRAIAYHPARYLNDGSLKQIHRILLTFLHRNIKTLNNTGIHGYEVLIARSFATFSVKVLPIRNIRHIENKKKY